MRPNLLRQKLNAGKATLGTRLHISWPAVVEAVGHTGMFDYVEFLAEYAPYDAFALENFCRAAELFQLTPMIKLDHEARTQVIQAVSAGFQSILFANCRSAADVAACVRLVRPETPKDEGEFGAVMGRFTYMEYGGGPDYVQALRDLVVVVMIEKVHAVEELDQILKVPGLDMIQWGSADYAMSSGLYANRHGSEVTAVGRRVIEACLKAGIQPRIELHTLDSIQEYLELGIRHFNLGVDLRIIYSHLLEKGRQLREMLAEDN
jgi:2-keto-3-deoxy-L-rhamnonate aldolase RhmA